MNFETIYTPRLFRSPAFAKRACAVVFVAVGLLLLTASAYGQSVPGFQAPDKPKVKDETPVAVKPLERTFDHPHLQPFRAPLGIARAHREPQAQIRELETSRDPFVAALEDLGRRAPRQERWIELRLLDHVEHRLGRIRNEHRASDLHVNFLLDTLDSHKPQAQNPPALQAEHVRNKAAQINVRSMPQRSLA